MTSVANDAETPYLTSSQVTGEPSSHVAPSRIVNFHDFASVGRRPGVGGEVGDQRVGCFSSLLSLYDVRLR
jgi:hypothetical protein